MRRDRPTFGGGLGVYIRDNIAYKRLYDLDCNAIENMWIEVATCEGKLLICNVYRPPNFTEFWDYLEANDEHVKSETAVKQILILGDLNADFGTLQGKKLQTFCDIHNFIPLIKDPTRITPD